MIPSSNISNHDLSRQLQSITDSSNKSNTKRTRKTVPKEFLTRKRLTNKAKWIQSARKVAVNCGASYTSKKGILVPARKLQNPCDESCRWICSTKITLDQRQEIHNTFWELYDHVL